MSLQKLIGKFGTNKKYKIQVKCYFHFLCEALKDIILIILIIAEEIQISFAVSPFRGDPEKDWIQGVTILFVVVLCV
jgi:hypothetical protein